MSDAKGTDRGLLVSCVWFRDVLGRINDRTFRFICADYVTVFIALGLSEFLKCGCLCVTTAANFFHAQGSSAFIAFLTLLQF